MCPWALAKSLYHYDGQGAVHAALLTVDSSIVTTRRDTIFEFLLPCKDHSLATAGAE